MNECMVLIPVAWTSGQRCPRELRVRVISGDRRTKDYRRYGIYEITRDQLDKIQKFGHVKEDFYYGTRFIVKQGARGEIHRNWVEIQKILGDKWGEGGK